MDLNFFRYDNLFNLLTPKDGNALPVIRLLKKDKAAFIISFLYREFKQYNILPVSNQDLIKKLAEFIDEIQDISIDSNLIFEDNLTKAKKLIEEWSNQDIIRQYPDETGENLHELTSHTERAIRWLESLKPREFVGTESRFRDIIRRLNELIEESTEDPEQKIKELESKKAELTADIDDKIRKIKMSGKVESFSEIQLKERYTNITEDSKELLSDFKEVEQNFRKITNEIYEKQFGNFKKGKILGVILDETEELEESPQGKSFYSFWEYLKLEDNQQDIHSLVRRIYKILDEKGVPIVDKFLQHLKIHLFDEGQKVIESNNLLMDKLSRTLSEKNIKNRIKALELTNDIQQYAIKLIDNPPRDENFFILEGNPEIDLLLDRPAQFNEPEEKTTFKNHPKNNSSDDSENGINSLFNHFEIDTKQLISNIYELLRFNNTTTLGEILKRFPLKYGIAELLAYYSIANKFQHQIIDNETELILMNNNKKQQIETPKLIFSK